MLKKKVSDEGWNENKILTEKQIRSLFSRFKNDRKNRGFKEMQAMQLNQIVREIANVTNSTEKMNVEEDNNTRKEFVSIMNVFLILCLAEM